jgi:hypothetical protein
MFWRSMAYQLLIGVIECAKKRKEERPEDLSSKDHDESARALAPLIVCSSRLELEFQGPLEVALRVGPAISCV